MQNQLRQELWPNGQWVQPQLLLQSGVKPECLTRGLLHRPGLPPPPTLRPTVPNRHWPTVQQRRGQFQRLLVALDQKTRVSPHERSQTRMKLLKNIFTKVFLLFIFVFLSLQLLPTDLLPQNPPPRPRQGLVQPAFRRPPGMSGSLKQSWQMKVGFWTVWFCFPEVQIHSFPGPEHFWAVLPNWRVSSVVQW